MGSVSDALRIFMPTNRLLAICLILCFFNYVLLSLRSNLQKDFCSTHHSANTRIRSKRSYEVKAENKSGRLHAHEANEYWLVELSKHSSFDWEKEVVSLMEVVPALETRTSDGPHDDAEVRMYEPSDGPSQWAQGLNKSPVLPLVTERIREKDLANKINDFNENRASNVDSNVKRQLMGCKEMRKLETSHAEPRVKYTFRSISGWKGTYSPTKTESIPIVLKRFERKKTPPKSTNEKANYVALARSENPYFDKSFERAKLEVLNLLRMQGWYGIPQLFAVCIATSNGEDITSLVLDHGAETNDRVDLKASTVRYMISRHDKGAKMCDTYYATEECHRIHPIMSLVHAAKIPAIAAIKVMLNTAKLFSQFYENKAFLYELIGTDFLVDSNYNVVLNDISTVKFSAGNEYSHNSGIHRLLSGTICTNSDQCAAATWQASTISYKFGLHCREVRGYCTDENRCWGIDSQAHACVLSRWFFGRLHSAIPVSWSRDGDLTKLLQCASKQSPYERCTWLQVKDGLDELLQDARKQWESDDGH